MCNRGGEGLCLWVSKRGGEGLCLSVSHRGGALPLGE